MRAKIDFMVLTLMLLLLTGCSDFLIEDNPNSLTQQEFYKTEKDVILGANGAYAALRGNGFYKNMYLYTEVRSDNTTVQDPGASSGLYYQFSNYTLQTDNSEIMNHWADLYKCITRTNVVIEAAKNVSFSDENDHNRVMAEMHFLRALSYMHLVFQFGDVPIVTIPLRTKDQIWEHTKRDPKAQVYNLILSDLNIVIESQLPHIQTGSGVGRASKAAANGLLGKVYLMKASDEDFASERQTNLRKAETHLLATWEAKPFANLKGISYVDIFDKDKQVGCEEILFQVMYQSGSSALSSNYNYIFEPSSQSGLTSVRSGSGFNIATADLVSSFEVNDIRKEISVGTSNNISYTKKYIDLDDSNGYGANNWIVLRYADVVLMLSEVYMHLQEEDKAITFLNMVRERAGLPDYNGNDLRDAIVKERRSEFSFEGQRWYDLIRLYTKNELLTLMSAKNENFTTKDFLLPIPYVEHNLDKERMYQNLGYN